MEAEQQKREKKENKKNEVPKKENSSSQGLDGNESSSNRTLLVTEFQEF